jgi:superfamily I DNA and RNA helicase
LPTHSGGSPEASPDAKALEMILAERIRRNKLFAGYLRSKLEQRLSGSGRALSVLTSLTDEQLVNKYLEFSKANPDANIFTKGSLVNVFREVPVLQVSGRTLLKSQGGSN